MILVSDLLLGWLAQFSGISTLVGYLMPNPVCTNIICKFIVHRAHLLNGFKYFYWKLSI